MPRINKDKCPISVAFSKGTTMHCSLRTVLVGNPAMMPITHAEIGHMHPTDGSMHMILSPSDAKVVIESGWGELHGLAGQVFAPGLRTCSRLYDDLLTTDEERT